MTVRLRLIRPSSREQADLLPPRIEELKAAGFEVAYDDLPPDPKWAYTSSTVAARAQALESALLEPSTDIVIAARGGYGASDLLPGLDWQRLKQGKPKLVVGFSDISALHAAIYAQLGWPGLHAPMPATALWRKNDTRDIEALFTNLVKFQAGAETSGSLALTAVSQNSPKKITGTLFGGCFTVITSLIGTPYFPPSLAGHILFLEDTDEHPGRLMRAFNQWQYSDALNGVRAIVIGYLKALGEKIPNCAPFVYERFADRTEIPVFSTPLFGHTSPNFPLMIGAAAVIEDQRLTWRFRSAVI